MGRKSEIRQIMLRRELSLTSKIRSAINEGAPVYNRGDKRGCYELYLSTAYSALSHEIRNENYENHNEEESEYVRGLLTAATSDASEKVRADDDYDAAAWILRRAFDKILQLELERRQKQNQQKNQKPKTPKDEKKEGKKVLSFAAPEKPEMEEPMPSKDDFSLQSKDDVGLLVKGDGSQERERGRQIVEMVRTIERVVKMKDRTYRLRTFKDCFVGSEALDSLVKSGVFISRDEAIREMKDVCKYGLASHVTNDHDFKDGFFFYRLSSSTELRKTLQSKFEGRGMSDSMTGDDLIRYAALLGRYKQFHKHPSLGVLRLDYDYPPAPGDIDHPDSYDYPVYYRVVPGLTFQMCQSGVLTPEVEENFDRAVLWLSEHKDVSAITGDCGFMMWFVDRVRRVNTRKPILLSSLMQVPTLAACTGPTGKILVVTANGSSLDPMLDLIRRQCGVDAQDTKLIFVGCEDVAHFGYEVENGLQVDVDKATPGIVSRVQNAVREHRDARFILFECTELPPYSDAVREATRLPVYDSITNCDAIMAGFLTSKNFGLNGWYEEWDGRQEAYALGQEVGQSQRLQRVWFGDDESEH